MDANKKGRTMTEYGRSLWGFLMPASSRSDLESARGYPEALAPLAARRNALQFLVHSCMRQVERVGDSGHGLEADEAPAGRSVNDGDGVLRPILDRNFLALPLHGKFGAAVRASYEIADHAVNLHP